VSPRQPVVSGKALVRALERDGGQPFASAAAM